MEHKIEDLDFGVETQVQNQAPAVATNAPFDYEFTQGKFYCFKTGERYQFLASNGAYHLLERLNNGVLMDVQYVGITDCASFRGDETRHEGNDIEIKLLEIRKEINQFPNLDTIPKESMMYKEVSKLWDDYYVLNKKKNEITKSTSSDNYDENVKKEVAKAKQFTAEMLAKAKSEKWTQEDLDAVLYPPTDIYEKFTPHASGKARAKILASME